MGLATFKHLSNCYNIVGTAQFINGCLIDLKTIKILLVAMNAERYTVNTFLGANSATPALFMIMLDYKVGYYNTYSTKWRKTLFISYG